MPRKRTAKPGPSSSDPLENPTSAEQAGGERSNKITRKNPSKRAQDEVALASAEAVAEIEKNASVQPVIVTNRSQTEKSEPAVGAIEKRHREFAAKGPSEAETSGTTASTRSQQEYQLYPDTEVSQEEQIALLAYSYWEDRGRQGGSPEDDWFRAEREIKNRYQQAAKSD